MVSSASSCRTVFLLFQFFSSSLNRLSSIHCRIEGLILRMSSLLFFWLDFGRNLSLSKFTFVHYEPQKENLSAASKSFLLPLLIYRQKTFLTENDSIELKKEPFFSTRLNSYILTNFMCTNIHCECVHLLSFHIIIKWTCCYLSNLLFFLHSKSCCPLSVLMSSTNNAFLSNWI